MVQTAAPQAPATSSYTVTRAIFMGGERVEIGAVVQMDRITASSAMAAGKVVPTPSRPPPRAAKAKPTTDSEANP